MYAIKEMAILQEAKDVQTFGDSKVRFKAKLQLLNSASYNGKIYLKEPMLKGLSAKEELLKRNGWVGELDHPIEPSLSRLLNILYKETSHIFKEIWTEGDEIWGILENTSNQHGLDLYAFIVKDRIPVGFSLRALGDVRKTSRGDEVYKNIDVVTWDCVSTPSFSTCLLTEIKNTKHLESYMAQQDLLNLEEYVYGNQESRHEMLLESKISKPTIKLINKIENAYLCDTPSLKHKLIRSMLRDETKKKLSIL